MNVCVLLLVMRIDDPFKEPQETSTSFQGDHIGADTWLSDCFVWNDTGPLRPQPQIDLEEEMKIPVVEDARRRRHQHASVWQRVFGEKLPWAWEPAFISHSTTLLGDCVASVNKTMFQFLLSCQYFPAFTSRCVPEQRCLDSIQSLWTFLLFLQHKWKKWIFPFRFSPVSIFDRILTKLKPDWMILKLTNQIARAMQCLTKL